MQSNPGFMFHDSGSFEAGSDVELEKVMSFIAHHSKVAIFCDQLHAIWYVISSWLVMLLTFMCQRFCLPVDGDHPFVGRDDFLQARNTAWYVCHTHWHVRQQAQLHWSSSCDCHLHQM